MRCAYVLAMVLLCGICFGSEKSGVSPQSISLPAGPGSVEGLGESFQPQLNTGVATYAVSIRVAPGIAGLEPSISVNHNPGFGNGCLGPGWALSVPAISRRTDQGQPSFSEADHYIDSSGELLLRLADGTYRRENELDGNFAQVTRLGANEAGGWEVRLKNGNVMRFGQYPSLDEPLRSSRVVRQTRVPGSPEAFDETFIWYLDEIRDTNGNRIEYRYESLAGSPGVIYLREVRYALTALSPSPAGILDPPQSSYHSVLLDYEERCDRTDLSAPVRRAGLADYRAGFAQVHGHRLRNIRVYAGGEPVRRYDFEYSGSSGCSDTPVDPASTVVSRLVKVQQRDASFANYLPPIRFQYTNFDPGASCIHTMTTPPNWDLAPLGPSTPHTGIDLFDADSDGLPDLVNGSVGGGWEWCRNTGLGFEPALPMASSPAGSLSSPAVRIFDIDGDAMPDYLRENVTNLEYRRFLGGATWNQTNNTFCQNPTFSFDDPEVAFLDIDFDKDIDALKLTPTGLRIWRNNRLECPPEPDSFEWTLEEIPFAAGLPMDLPTSLDDNNIRWADMNGDRLLDLVEVVAAFGTLSVQYWANKGNGQFEMSVSFEQLPFFPTNDEDRLLLFDVNTDGLADLVFQDSSELHFWVNRGDGSFLGELGSPPLGVVIDTPSASAATPLRVADMNADGVTDILYNQIADPAERYQYLSFCGGQVPYQLQMIDRGIGNKTTIEYASVASYREEASVPWQSTLPLGMQVVSRFYVECGFDLDGLPGGIDQEGQLFPATDRYITDLIYRDPYYDALERQFRGFAFVEKIDRGDDYFGNPVISAPSQVTRIRYHTGAPDGVDNDGDGEIDESNPEVGREEEPLKGMKLWTEVARVPPSGWVSPGAVFLPDSEVFVRTTNELSVVRLHAAAGTPPALLPQLVLLDSHEVRFPFIAATQIELVERASAPPVTLLREYEYDAFGNLLEEYDHGSVGTAQNDERVVSMEYTYDFAAWILDRPQRVLVTDENGAWVQETLHDYDDRGRPTRETHLLQEGGGPGQAVAVATMSYDDLGNLTQITNARGFSRFIDYDAMFGIYPVSESIEVGGGQNNLEAEASYDPRFGVLTSAIDYNAQERSYRYDSFGRLVATILPGDSEEWPTSRYEYVLGDAINGIRYEYDALGNVTETTGLGTVPSVVRTLRRETFQQAGMVESFGYSDGLGRTLSSWIEHEQGFAVVSAQLYNARGSARAGFLPLEGVGGYLTASPLVDSMLPHSDTYYDALGRVIRTVLPEDQQGVRHEESVSYLPLQTMSFDAEDSLAGSPHENTPVTRRRDGLGRIVEVSEVNNLGASPGPTTTSFEYDLQNNVTSVVDALGNVKTMTYDGMGRRTTLHDPDSGLFQFTYDSTSNVVQTFDALQRAITYTHDGANRLLTEDYGDDGVDVSYFYDQPQPGYPMATNLAGRLALVEDLSGAEYSGYDARGNRTMVLKQIERINGELDSFQTLADYDSMDRKWRLRYPDGQSIQYIYNDRGLLSAIPGIVDSLTYTVSGQRESCNLANGVSTEYSYDPRTRLRSIISNSPVVSDLQDLTYELDGVNNIRQMVDGRASLLPGDPRSMSQTFEYDDFYRVTEVTGVGYGSGDGVVSFTYDPLGNITSKASSTIPDPSLNLGMLLYGGSLGTVGRQGRMPGDPAGPHAVTSVGNTSFEYDDVGNRIRRWENGTSCPGVDCDEYSWDFKNRLVQVSSSTGEQATFVYDYADRRVRKDVTGQPDSEVLYVGSHCEVRQGTFVKYVFAGNQRLARIEGPIPPATGPVLHRKVLSPGWNLVGLDLMPPTTDAEQLFSSIEGHFAGVYRLVGNSYQQFVPGEPSTLVVEEGASFWIFALDHCTWDVVGVGSQASEAQIGAGWNQIVVPGGGVAELEGLVSGNANVLSVWGRALTDAGWEGFSVGHPEFVQSKERWVDGESVFLQALNAGSVVGPLLPNRVYFYHPDHLGTCNIVTDETGAIIEEQYFYPFGLPRFRFVPGADDYTSEYTFAGKEFDLTSGAYYFGTRHYDPIVGQFLSFDGLLLRSPALGAGQFLHGYAYCNNNPIVCVDPNGEFLFAAIAIGAAIGGISAAANGGDIGDIFKGALIGGLVGGISGGVGAIAGPVVGGMAGGATNAALNGGDFGDVLIGAALGGLSGGVGAATGSVATDMLGNSVGATIASGAISGGLSSFLVGGIVTGNFSLRSFALGATQGGIGAGLSRCLRGASTGSINGQGSEVAQVDSRARSESPPLSSASSSTRAPQANPTPASANPNTSSQESQPWLSFRVGQSVRDSSPFGSIDPNTGVYSVDIPGTPVGVSSDGSFSIGPLGFSPEGLSIEMSVPVVNGPGFTGNIDIGVSISREAIDSTTSHSGPFPSGPGVLWDALFGD